MSLYNGPPRPGARGGRDQFSWENVRNDKDREFYLGHSVKALTGRWQKNKDVYWYTREKQSQDSLADELRAVKAREEELMMEALGVKPKSTQSAAPPALDKHDLEKLLKRSGSGAQDEAGAGGAGAAAGATATDNPDRIRGLGFSAGHAGPSAGGMGMELGGTMAGTGVVPGDALAGAGPSGRPLPGPPPPGAPGSWAAMVAAGIKVSSSQLKQLSKEERKAAKKAIKEAKKANKKSRKEKKLKKKKARHRSSSSSSGSSSSDDDSDREGGQPAAPRGGPAGHGSSGRVKEQPGSAQDTHRGRDGVQYAHRDGHGDVREDRRHQPKRARHDSPTSDAEPPRGRDYDRERGYDRGQERRRVSGSVGEREQEREYVDTRDRAHVPRASDRDRGYREHGGERRYEREEQRGREYEGGQRDERLRAQHGRRQDQDREREQGRARDGGRPEADPQRDRDPRGARSPGAEAADRGGRGRGRGDRARSRSRSLSHSPARRGRSRSAEAKSQEVLHRRHDTP